MLNNKRTTILGYVLLGGAILDFGTAMFAGGDLNSARADLMAAAAGLGLINASDGGH